MQHLITASVLDSLDIWFFWKKSFFLLNDRNNFIMHREPQTEFHWLELLWIKLMTLALHWGTVFWLTDILQLQALRFLFFLIKTNTMMLWVIVTAPPFFSSDSQKQNLKKSCDSGGNIKQTDLTQRKKYLISWNNKKLNWIFNIWNNIWWPRGGAVPSKKKEQKEKRKT